MIFGFELRYHLVTDGSPILLSPLVTGTDAGTFSKVDFDPNSAAEELPGYLTNYARAASWEAVCLDNILYDDGPLAAKNSYLKGAVIQTQDPNLVFERVRNRLPHACYFAFGFITAENTKFSLSSRLNKLTFRAYYPVHFLIKRVLLRSKSLRSLCQLLPIFPDVSKAELMGRLIYKGFSVIDIIDGNYETTFIVKPDSASNPSLTRPLPSHGLIVKMQRLGQFAKPIYVYKLRTMHPYSEYVQAYLHEQNGLDQGGKFKNDFRVIAGGNVIRKYWLDEIPMLYNLLRGDLKLIGIRPLSEHYFSLYPVAAQAIRIKHKPGLLPPFYADLPQTFDEIVQSELTYLAAYEAAPLATDLRYLRRILVNIIINKARSK